jgi:hypothetical protein
LPRLGNERARGYVKLMSETTAKSPPQPPAPAAATTGKRTPEAAPPREIGGPQGPEPTRYGDWEHKGRCSDF